MYVAGHRGLVGSAILRKLQETGHTNLVFRTSRKLDLRRQKRVEEFFEKEEPQFVFLAAGKVGGVMANTSFPAEFIYDNLMIETNVIHCAYKFRVEKLLFLGSSCIYPKDASQPMKEEYLLSGRLEPTNEPYAVAKIAGIKLCQSYNREYGTNFISVMPTNLYGPNDNFDLETSHVIPALIRKFHEAKINEKRFVEIWGTGSPRREFLYVDDLADACIFLIKHYGDSEIINVGTGKGISINELALMISEVVGFEGELRYDTTKPDGTPRKLLDISKINKLGWKARTDLREGIKATYHWFLAQTVSRHCAIKVLR